MNYTRSEIYYQSSDGKNRIYGEIFTPNGDIRGIVQLSHGMVDHTGRYYLLADYLASHGYVFAGNCHLGHGKSAATADDLGYFGDSGGVNYLLADLYEMNRILAKKFPSAPIILLGHSMGSFLSRLFVEKYPGAVSAHIIHGTGGPHRAMIPFGKLLVKLTCAIKGKRYRSKFIAKLAFMGYTKKFPKSEGIYAWLSRDGSMIADRDTDPFTQYIFTDSAYYELFYMVGKSNAFSWFKAYPKDLPTLIMSGDMDPVGDYGKGPTYIYKKLIKGGAAKTELKLYEGARHELFNELCRNEVFDDILAFIERSAK